MNTPQLFDLELTKPKLRTQVFWLDKMWNRVKSIARPKWARERDIKPFYREARQRSRMYRENWVVDHVVPLRSMLVCGLHCPDNLQVIKKGANDAKANYWWPNMWEYGSSDGERVDEQLELSL